ncbi:hypothetical protein CFO_g1344 [Ceratocystis platani]|uniref:CCHC-type domain-containing protein n=1 Tax=Ceratocystis fimbriata f. sp. platani TaxID=88771 RepID=A0A0F8B6C6_CERFI|nr:hypothetical protein CFO_g1344 [Ceratocystis platani]
MSIILHGSNWKEWETNFLVQLKNAGLHYLLQKDSMEGVEGTDSFDASQKQNYTKDQEEAKSLLDLSLNEFFQTIVGDEATFYEAYQVLKEACAPDPLEAAYEEYKKALRSPLAKEACAPDPLEVEYEKYKKVLRSPLAKDKTMLQNWLYFKAVHNQCFMRGETEKDEDLKKKRSFYHFLWQLPRGYKEAILESARGNYDISKTITLLEKVRNDISGKEKDRKTRGNRPKVKCSNCEKKGHVASDCWSKKKTNPDQKAQL